MPTGHISSRGWNNGFTFIESSDRKRVFFHVSGIAPGYGIADFTPGSEVEYMEEVTDRGTQAKAVTCLNRAEPLSARMIQSQVEGRITSWLGHRGFGFAAVEDLTGVFVHIKDVLTPQIEEGSLVRGDLVEGSDGRPKLINAAVTGWTATGDTWHDWAYMPPGWERALAEMAEPEHWDYRFTESSTPMPVLRKYLRGTFLRLLETSKIVESDMPDRRYAAFNTGLVTPLQQEIIAVFESDQLGARYKLKGFDLEGSRELLSLFGAAQPSIATYFDNPADVIFDTSLPFYIAVEHVDDRLARAPKELQGNRDGFIRTINAQREIIQRRVARNYKTAIPQYYRSGGRGVGSLQLLVPLCLVKPDRVDLALAVEKINGVYRGNTVLTVDMAYTHARLITRPDTEWLRPEGQAVQPSVVVLDEDVE